MAMCAAAPCASLLPRCPTSAIGSSLSEHNACWLTEEREPDVKRRRLIRDADKVHSDIARRLERQREFLGAFNRKLGETPSQHKGSHSMGEAQSQLLESPTTEMLDRVRFRIKLCRKGIGKYDVHALGFACEWGCPRFARKYGADRFMHVTVDAENGNRSLNDSRHILQPFFWLGRKWVCVRSKSKKPDYRKHTRVDNEHDKSSQSLIFFAERNCSVDEESLCQNLRQPTPFLPGSDTLQEISGNDVLRSHLPQRVCSSCPADCQQHFLCRSGRPAYPEAELLRNGKYSKRIDLGWTDAEPTEEFEASDIREIEDLESRAKPGEVLSDGNGLISLARAKRISRTLGLDYVPAVFQVRLGCAKGTLTVHYALPDNEVHLSRQMCKWAVDWAGCGSVDRCLEVKAWSKHSSVAQSLNPQYIAVCSSKGVPAEVFTDLAKQHVEGLAEETLKDPCSSHGLPGYKEAEEGKTRLALQMIDAGIGMSEPICTKWVLSYLLGQVKRVRNEAHYNCPECWHAFIVPDWEQKLLPDECIFKHPAGHFVEGLVSLARSPCTAAWDVQVLRALGPREIFQRFGATTPPYLIDGIIVLSAHPTCACAPASVLAGGDHDGDKAMLNAYEPIVSKLQPTRFDPHIIVDLQKRFGRKPPSLHQSVPQDPLDAIIHAHYSDSKSGPLVGGLGNQWAFLCDEAKAGASDPVVLQVGLLFQEALDGKLDPELDMDKIWKSVCLSKPKSLPPHWHEKSWEQLKDVKGDDVAMLDRLILKRRVRRSMSALGALFDSVDVYRMLDEWRNRYGPDHYRFEQVAKQVGVKPHPLLQFTHRSAPFLNSARHLLETYFAESSKIIHQHKLGKGPSQKALRDKVQKELFHGSANFDESCDRALAFYHAQVQRFNDRVREQKQKWTAESVEYHLEPAWTIATAELCALAASRSGVKVCFVSETRRSNLRYKTSAKQAFAWLDVLCKPAGKRAHSF